MRSVLHIRVKDFYASVECACEPRLQNEPISIRGTTKADNGIVISRNDMAGALGVTTGQTIIQARLNCQNLTVLRPDYNKYLNLSRKLKAICSDYTDRIEAFGMDELYLDVGACHTGAKDLAHVLQKRAREELGLALCVGSSFNKAFARLASAMAVPGAIMTVTPENFRQKLWRLPVGQLMYVNTSIQRKLNELGINTIGDFACADVKLLYDVLGIQGYLLREFAQGNDVSPVRCEGLATWDYSIGNSIATPLALRSDSDVERLIQLLAESIAETLRKLCLRGDSISLEVGDCDHSPHCFQKKLVRPTASAGDITGAVRSLFRENWYWYKPVHSLRLSVSPFILAESSLQPKPVQRTDLHRCELENAVDDLRRRFGHAIISRACLLHNDIAAVVHPQLVQMSNVTA